MSRKSIPPENRFWDKVQKTPTCWLWTGKRIKSGYGVLSIGTNRTIGAHRVSYQIHFGEIPEGYYICHHCDNPSCVNPAHLFAGTNSDNQLDASKKGRHARQTQPEATARGERHWCFTNPEKVTRGEQHATAKLNESQVKSIRESYSQGGVTQKALALTYGVSAGAITKIICRKNWKHI